MKLDVKPNLTQMLVMIQMQDAMNTKVHPEWKSQGFAWMRAAWIECAEMMDHHGWKWWKKQEPDMPQVQMELVDIWHFFLSFMGERISQNGLDTEEALSDLINSIDESSIGVVAPDGNLLEAIERIASHALTFRGLNLPAFFRALELSGMSFNDLYVQYVGKNVLNFFRQGNGYKDGSYRKHWHDGREDNEHLVEVIASLDASAPNFKDEVYAGLQARYIVISDETVVA